MLRANHFVNSHEQGVRTKERSGRATVNSWRQDRPRSRGGQKLAALVVRREDSTNSPSTDRCHGRLPYVLNDYFPFYQERLEHHVRIGTICLICALLNNMVTSSLRGALTDARSEVPFSMEQYSITCVSTQSQLCLCLSHSSSCACRQAAVFTQVEVRRSSSTGMMGSVGGT